MSSRRSPMRDSRDGNKKADPKQSSPILSYNIPLTNILQNIKDGYSNISIGYEKTDEGGEWITTYENNNDAGGGKKKTKVTVFNKSFEFNVNDNCIKLSGPGSDSLNLMVRYMLQILNSEANNNQIEQRCKTVNKKIATMLPANFDYSCVPLDFLIEVYENCINGVPVIRSSLTTTSLARTVPQKSSSSSSSSKKTPPKKISPQKTKEKEDVKKYMIIPGEHDSTTFKTSIPTNFFLAPSKYLELKENGLFTKEKIPNNTPVYEYKGLVYDKSYSALPYDKLYIKWFHPKNVSGVNYILRNKSYEIEINNTIIDASIQNRSSFARYVNSGFPNYYRNNCEFVQDNNKVILVTTREIDAGEELLCSYGINSESNVTNSQSKISINITKIPETISEDMSIEYDEIVITNTNNSEKKEVKNKSMGFEDFAKKYYESLISFLNGNNKMKFFSSYLSKLKEKCLNEVKNNLNNYKYEPSEFEKFKDAEFEAFKNKIEKKIEECKGKKLSGYKELHYKQLVEYFEELNSASEKKVVEEEKKDVDSLTNSFNDLKIVARTSNKKRSQKRKR